MGLIDVLGYETPRLRPLQRLANRMAGNRFGAAIAGPLLRPADLIFDRLSRGGSSLTESLGGQPVLWLDVSRSDGTTRQVPLLPIPTVDDIAVIGSNFGRPAQPTWAIDLARHPRVGVRLGRRETRGLARRASPDEEEAIWIVAGRLYPGYLRYRGQVTGREIRVFVLEPDPAVPSTQ